MTVAPALQPSAVVTSSSANPEQPARISFRQPVSSSGAVDAAWWPHTRDMTHELPQLLDVLWSADRKIEHVTYHLGEWEPVPRRMTVEGRLVRLGGFATSNPLTVRLTGSAGNERIDVLVVPPDTDPAVAERALRLASVADSALTAGEILQRAANPTETDTDGAR